VYRLLGGRTPTQRAVRPLRVVALPPLLTDLASVSQAPEPLDSETLVAELAVEACEVAMLHRPTRINEIQLNAVLLGPDIERLARELWTSIQGDLLGDAVPLEHLLEEAHHSLAR
jgi:hypothetical protein